MESERSSRSDFEVDIVFRVDIQSDPFTSKESYEGGHCESMFLSMVKVFDTCYSDILTMVFVCDRDLVLRLDKMGGIQIIQSFYNKLRTFKAGILSH